MKGYTKKQEILNVVYKCLKEYDENLKNKKLMFILENKDRTISKEEVFFPKSSYYHLTGITICSKDGKKLNSYEFYELLKSVSITVDNYQIECKDKTTDLKLQVLPQLMRIDRMANMLGVRQFGV